MQANLNLLSFKQIIFIKKHCLQIGLLYYSHIHLMSAVSRLLSFGSVEKDDNTKIKAIVVKMSFLICDLFLVQK